MLYKALVSFSGKVSMTMDEVRDISDQSIAKDLLHAGLIEEVKSVTKAQPEKKVEAEAQPEKKVEAEAQPKSEAKPKTRTKRNASSKK